MRMKKYAHAIYDTRYHLVWAPKHRKWMLRGDIRKRVEELFKEIAEVHDMEIEELALEKEHVHIFFRFSAKIFDSTGYKVF